MKLPVISRKELYEASLMDLFALHGEAVELEARTKAELIARGEY